MTINRDVANIASRPNITRRDHVYPLITNGDMRIAQRGTSSTGVGANNQYETVDMFRHNFVAANSGRLTSSQSTDVPTGQGFKHSLKLDCTTADTSIAAGEWGQIYTGIEAQNLTMWNKGTTSCRTITVCFWAKGTAKTYVCELYDTDNNRQISKLFTVTTDWKKHVINFPADTSTSDDLTYDSDAGLQLQFQIHAGSTYTSGTLNSEAWNDVNNANRYPGIESFFSSTDNELYLTGVQLEFDTYAEGTEPPFQFVDQATQLLHCQRYAQLLANGDDQCLGFGYYYNANHIIFQAHHKNAMRAAPTIELTTTASNDNFAINTRSTTDTFDTLDGVQQAHEMGTAIYVGGDGAAGTSGDNGDVRTNHADVKLILSADF